MTARSLLALSGDASRTGAPRLLTSLLGELLAQGALDPAGTRVLLGAGGPLETDLDQVASIRVLPSLSALGGPLAAMVHPSARAVGQMAALNLGLMARPVRDPGPPDVVWANGAGATRMAGALPRSARGAPLVAHVHELDIGLRRSLAGSDPRTALDRADVVVAVSLAVRDHLVGAVDLDPDRVTVHHGWVPRTGRGSVAVPAPLRRPPDVPDEALLVGACGSVGWRKGADLFLDLARTLPDEVDGRPVHLVWIGGPARPDDDKRMAADIGLRGLSDRVHLVGEVADATPWLSGLDVLAHPAREDPFPLTVLEAGAVGVPVVGFRSGGIVEAIPAADHGACLADLFDGDGLAERVLSLLQDPAERRRRGSSIRDLVREHYCAGPSVAALWADVEARLGWA